MKNNILRVLSVVLVLFLLISCNGNVSEKLFHSEHSFQVQEDGSLLCECGESIKESYIAFYNEKGTINKFYLIEDAVKKGLMSCSSNTNYGYENLGTGKKVVIKLDNPQVSLQINAPNDEIAHYGSVGSVQITAVKDSSYSERGRVAFIDIKTGRLALEASSSVKRVHFSKTGNDFLNIKVAIDHKSVVPKFSRDQVNVNSIGTKKLVVEIQDSTEIAKANSDFIYLYNQGVYEQIKVTEVLEDLTNAVFADDVSVQPNTRTVAREIANMYVAERVDDKPQWKDATLRTLEIDDVVDSGISETSKTDIIEDCISESHEHAAGAYKYDRNYHWKECSGCDEILEKRQHDWNDNLVCKDCGYLFIDGADVIITKNGENPSYMTIAAFRDSVNNGNSYSGYTVTLLRDLTMTSDNWTPIGIKDDVNLKPFSGIFDGDGYKITGFKSSNRNYCSFIQAVKDGEVKNLTVYGSICTTNTNSQESNISNAAGIVGYTTGNCKVENCVSYVDIRVSGDSASKVGGIICKNDGKLTITSCTNYGNIRHSDGYWTGGIIACVEGDGETKTVDANKVVLENCSNYGNLYVYRSGDEVNKESGNFFVADFAAKIQKFATLYVKNCTTGTNKLYNLTANGDVGSEIPSETRNIVGINKFSFVNIEGTWLYKYRSVSKIEIITSPTNKQYIGYAFNKKGMQVKITYNSDFTDPAGSGPFTEVVSATDFGKKGISVGVYESGKTDKFSIHGTNKSIYVSYRDYDEIISTIDVYYKDTIVSINVTTSPTNVQLRGKEFDSTGMKIAIVYDDGTSKSISQTSFKNKGVKVFTSTSDNKFQTTGTDVKYYISYTDFVQEKTIEVINKSVFLTGAIEGEAVGINLDNWGKFTFTLIVDSEDLSKNKECSAKVSKGKVYLSTDGGENYSYKLEGLTVDGEVPISFGSIYNVINR